MSSKDTRLVPSDIAFRSLVLIDDMLYLWNLCCFVARLQSQQSDIHVIGFSYAVGSYDKYILISCSLFSLKFTQK